MSNIGQQRELVVKAYQNNSSIEILDEGGHSKPSIGMLAPLFLEWARYEARRSVSTVARYGESLRWVLRLVGDHRVDELHMGHLLALRRALEERGCREARVAGILNALRSFLKFCREILRIPALDYREVRVPRIPRRDVVYLTIEEVRQFLEAIIGPAEELERVPTPRLRFRALVEVLLGTGARISEALALNRFTLDFERREARVIGKGNKERTLFFTPRSLAWLERYLARRWDDDEAAFVGQGDCPKRLTQKTLKDQFKVYRRRAGLTKPVSAHILRHTMATTLLFNGCPIGHIKEVLGHERLETTCRYYLGLDKRAAKEAHRKYLSYEP
jgi:integrase/recombinase XerD